MMKDILDSMPYVWRYRLSYISVGLVAVGILTGWFDGWLAVVLIKSLHFTVKTLVGLVLGFVAYAIYSARVQ